MAIELQCPSCGAPQELRNPGITTVVCDRCDTTLYRREAVLVAGKKAIPQEPRSTVAVGGSGWVGAQTVAVVGRVQFRHHAGRWDEWYVDLGDGAPAWLVEDERRYSVERPIEGVEGARADLALGARLAYGGTRFAVDEIGEAVCAGGEGQLPRTFTPGEALRYVDCTEVGGKRRLLLEFHHDGRVEAFLGTDIDPGQVRIAGGSRPAIASEATSHLRCPNCGFNVAVPRQSEVVRTLSCSACDGVLQLDDAAARVVGRNPKRPHFDFAVGERCRFDGCSFEVVGRLAYREDEDVDREYLLWSDQGGYRWLERTEGRFILYRPTREGPTLEELRRTPVGVSLSFGDHPFRMAERGTCRVIYVDGALPWAASVGDRFDYFGLRRGDQVLCAETSDTEVERFVGQVRQAREVFGAFGRNPPRTITHRHAVVQTLLGVGGVTCAFGMVNLLIAIWGAAQGERVATAQAMSGRDAEHAAEVASQPFALAGGARLLALDISSPVDNTWVYVESELVGADGAPVAVSGDEVEYYHGYEGGESWAEGSTSVVRYVKSPGPGTYRLVVAAEGEVAVPVSVEVRAGVFMSRYPLCFGVALLFGGIGSFLLAGAMAEKGKSP